MRFCRAALSTLAPAHAISDLSRMKWKINQADCYVDRVRRSSREIVIAAVLTVAAGAFLIAAMFGNAAVDSAKLGAVASDQTTIK